ncbi:uncharacterized protein [Eleutherodactylus coqui]|uniref:uncharacterized protein isoform X1 n=1 Tax=Eleutherodactylus coqui TaxID=57060 RepID=UPI0034622EC2
MHCQEENPSASDHKGIVSTYRNDLRIISKSICFTHSLKSSEQVNRLNDKTNKARVLDYPRRGCRTPCEADDSRLPIDESEMASKACDSRLFHKESGLGKPINILNPSSFLQTYKLNSMACPVNLFSDSPITANKAFEGVSVNQTVCNVGPFAGQKLKEINGIMPPGWSSSGLSNSRNMAINSPEGVTNSSQIDTNISQFQCYKDYTPQQNIQSVSKRNRPSLFSMLQSPNTLVANSRKMSINSPEGVTNSSQIDTNLSQFQCYKDYTPQLDIQPVSKRNRPSLFSMLQSPNASVAKLNCSMHDKIKTLSKTMTAQSQMEVDERNHAIFKIHMEQLQNRPCSLSKGHSFSAFPVARSTNQDFDSVCTQAQSQPVDKGQVHLSKTVSSLVNSPGSLKAKRPLKHDFSFSPSKKPRSVTEAIIGTSKAFSPDHNKTLLSSKEQRFFPPQHSVVASPPPSDLSPYSGEVTRFIPPNTYGITPKRFASRYRKLVYEENCTNPGNE